MPRERTSRWTRDMKVAQSRHIEAGHGIGNSRRPFPGDLPLSVECTIMTDSTQVLSGSTASRDSFLNIRFNFYPEYPDPYLELRFKCQYHDKPPPSELEEDVHAGLDERVSAQGYRTSYEGRVRFTSSDVKAFRIINLELPNDENKDLGKMNFSDAIKFWDSALATPEMTKNGPQYWPEVLTTGNLNILRIEFPYERQLKTIGMHPPHRVGEHDEKWRQITNHILQSQTLNILLPMPDDLIRDDLDAIWHRWENMRETPPFAEFYGNTKKSSKSGDPKDLISRKDRPTDFRYSAQVGFMHRHEYVVSLACGYIDEDDHNRAADRDSDADSTERKQILAACQEMWTKRRAMKDIWDILLMQRASEFPEVDFYGTVDPTYDFTRLLSKLNNGQKAALQKLRKITGCGTSLQGPPGTGKTYWASHIVIPLVESAHTDTGLPHRILAVAATNEQADKLAEDLRKFLSKNVDRDLGKEVIVIRVLPWQVESRIAAEEDIAERRKHFDRQDAEAVALINEVIHCSNPTSSSDEDTQRVGEMLRRLRISKSIPESNLRDPRVRDLRLHLGTRMFEVLMSHPDQDSRSQNWKTLRRQLASFRRGKTLTPTQILEMKEGILQLRDAVIQSADVLVATPYAACEEYLCRVFKPTHIVVDEANQISEPRLWPLLASYTHANNEQFKAMVLIGDQEQLPPTVMAKKDKCFFRDQLQMSLFTRMQKNGLSLPALCQQRRMHRDIADCPRRLSYGDRLTTHLSTSHMMNKEALRVRRLNAALFKMHSNLVVIDNKSGQQQKDPATGSSFNEENVQVVRALVEKLLTSEAAGGPVIQPDRICVLTFYAAQEELIWEEMHRLRRARPQLRVQAINVSTVDRYQGNESDIVILDMVVVSGRSFVEEAGRLNSALTRARHGLYVIASYEVPKAFLDRRAKRSYLWSVMERWDLKKVICEPRFVLKHLEAWKAQKDDMAGSKR